MKQYAPKYYRDFTCIAARCRHTCCIGWEIDVDEAAMAKYAARRDPYGKRVLASIEQNGEDAAHFRLQEGERCPHLDEQGLCRIITTLGEDCLCDVCREHPRFYNTSALGLEMGVGMACEEACRLILTSDDYAVLMCVGSAEGETVSPEFDTVGARDALYAILREHGLPYPERLQRIYHAFAVSPSLCTDEEWRHLLASLEYLHPENRELFAAYTSAPFTLKETEAVLERALAYFIFRHCTKTDTRDEHRAALGLCLFLERLLSSLIKKACLTEPDAIFDLARTLSEEIEYNEESTAAIRDAFFLAFPN